MWPHAHVANSVTATLSPVSVPSRAVFRLLRTLEALEDGTQSENNTATAAQINIEEYV